ncbi:Transcription termination factor 5, mitochondrial [Pseudolycoriella hygida]|uniref:Transcription termination factor 5, mitochondrial n=1 Tax=Pseudolycoriella hygida TaxID=35572 RepID=A0A9Q0S812_9DIPT|nr:Transcription termination factor 5, mitochondrial [Pseudolycoriella hygida]
MGVIDDHIDVQSRLADYLNVKLRRCDDNKPLKDVRLHILKLFVSENKLMTGVQFRKLIVEKSWNSLNLSYRWITEVLKLSKKHFEPDRKFLRDLLAIDPFNLSKLLTINSIGGKDIKNILRENPNLMKVPYEQFVDTLVELRRMGYSDDSIINFPKILLLNSTKIKSRIAFLRNIKLFSAVKRDPKILELLYLNPCEVRSRLNDISEFNKKCLSVYAFTMGRKNCERFAFKQYDKYPSKYIMEFFSKVLEADKEDLNEMERHPYWNCIQMNHIEDTIKRLRREGFGLQDIRRSIHIVLYPWEVINNELEKLRELKQMLGVPLCCLSKSTLLKLITYNIEVRTKFSGDGVWQGRKEEKLLKESFSENSTSDNTSQSEV